MLRLGKLEADEIRFSELDVNVLFCTDSKVEVLHSRPRPPQIYRLILIFVLLCGEYKNHLLPQTGKVGEQLRKIVQMAKRLPGRLLFS
jgi:hypothetical protein